MKDILAEITRYRESRGWTEYQLAERSGLPQSTISSWYRQEDDAFPAIAGEGLRGAGHHAVPAAGGGRENSGAVPREQELLRRWSRLNDAQKQALLDLMDTF